MQDKKIKSNVRKEMLQKYKKKKNISPNLPMEN